MAAAYPRTMPKDRIASFERRDLSNVARPGPLGRAASHISPSPPSAAAIALTQEAVRAVRSGACGYCAGRMKRLEVLTGGSLLYCPDCGYWAGRGTRLGGPVDNRVARGLLDLVDLDQATIDQLLGHLRTVPDRMRQLDPFRAESFMVELLAETLGCEVRPVGGRKDGGVDGYIVAGDGRRAIVQVKWRETTDKGESVSVVREVAGTMLARGVPAALIVTSRTHMSRPATLEMAEIAQREVVHLGRLRISAMVYQDIIDMLDLAWTRRGGDIAAVTPWLREGTPESGIGDEPNRDWVFDHVNGP